MQRKNIFTRALWIAGFGNFIGARRIHNAIEFSKQFTFFRTGDPCLLFAIDLKV
jgi:hypothetical protein